MSSGFITDSTFMYIHTAGSDYESETFMLEFLPTDEGTTTLCANVPIIDDQLGNEPVEAFSVSFVSFSPAGQEGPNRETCVFIEDDDGMYNLSHLMHGHAMIHPDHIEDGMPFELSFTDSVSYSLYYFSIPNSIVSHIALYCMKCLCECTYPLLGFTSGGGGCLLPMFFLFALLITLAQDIILCQQLQVQDFTLLYYYCSAWNHLDWQECHYSWGRWQRTVLHEWHWHGPALQCLSRISWKGWQSSFW